MADLEFEFTLACCVCFLDAACPSLRYTLDASTSILEFDDSHASLLGKGSSAFVYRGKLNSRPIAVKVCRRACATQPRRIFHLGAKDEARADWVQCVDIAAGAFACGFSYGFRGYSRGTQGLEGYCSIPRAGFQASGIISVRTSKGTLPFAEVTCRVLSKRQRRHWPCALVRYSATCSTSSYS